MKIYFDTDSHNRVIGYGSSPTTTTCVEIEVEEGHDVFDNPSCYLLDSENNLVYDNSAVLANYIKQKDIELNLVCNNIITGRFPVELGGTVYYFSNDAEAQSNFGKMLTAFDKGWVTELRWTTYLEDGSVYRILLNPENFSIVYHAHLNHIQSNISKYRDVLYPLLMEATTPEEVDDVHWDMTIP